MTLIFTSIALVLIFIKYSIFIDIILSWLTLVGFKARPQFLGAILDPLYEGVRKRIPTTIGPLDFTPIVLFILIEVLIVLIYGLSSETHAQINNLFNLF